MEPNYQWPGRSFRIPDEAISVLDQYASEHGLTSRAQALLTAITLLDLGDHTTMEAYLAELDTRDLAHLYV